MTDEPKKPMTATEFVEKHRELKFAKGGRLYFDGGLLPGDDEINLMRVRERTFNGPEVVLPKDHPLASRMHRYGDPVTGRFGSRPTFMMTIRAVDRMTQGFRAGTDAIRRLSDTMYYGPRIAKLLHSTDPRQRKRGKRLRDKRMAWGTNWTELEARALVDDFRQEYPDLKRFWNTELGEPYDPERYRKD